jgi:excisionase family DNA binding protein
MERIDVKTEEEVQSVLPENPVCENGNSSPAAPLRLAFSIKETSEILGISEKSVRRLIIRGLLRPSRALRTLLIPRRELERFLDETSSR